MRHARQSGKRPVGAIAVGAAALLIVAVIAAAIIGYVLHPTTAALPPATNVQVSVAPSISPHVTINAPAPTISIPTPTVTIITTPPAPKITPRSSRAPHPRLVPPSCLPDYPGQIRLGERGSAARAWQSILIAAGVISDLPENHDSYYGPAMMREVYALQAGWGWTPPNGIAGPRTYTQLTLESCH